MFKKGWQPENYKGVHDEIKQQHMKAKDMTFKGRMEYFWYYYKVHTLVAVLLLIFGGMLFCPTLPLSIPKPLRLPLANTHSLI